MCSAFSAEKVVYPIATKREHDIEELLYILINASEEKFGPCELTPFHENINEAKIRYFITHDLVFDIIWSSNTPDLEKHLIPIWHPIRKGLLGYRIFLIRKQDQPMFSSIRTIEDLKKLTVGQGRFWNDVKVFQANGIKVKTSMHYESLFDMVAKGRVDYFSRGFNEIFTEYKEHVVRLPNLNIERDILIYYPWPKFFYVSKKNPKLAKRLIYAFKRIKENGKYEEWFLKHNKESIKKANLPSRRLFTLDNPLFTKKELLNHINLWFDPLKQLQ